MRKILTSIMLIMLIIGATFSVQAKSSLQHKHTADCEKTLAEPVQIICILDRSGSMHSLANDVIGGYNSFLDKQKKESGKAEVTTVLFDDQYEKIVNAADIQTAENLTSAIYYARGNTALMDAVGRTITETLAQMEKEKICPAKRRVLIMIMTDGLENASKEYNKASVKSLIDATTKDYGWKIGIDSSRASNISADSEGIKESFERMNTAAKEVREK